MRPESSCQGEGVMGWCRGLHVTSAHPEVFSRVCQHFVTTPSTFPAWDCSGAPGCSGKSMSLTLAKLAPTHNCSSHGAPVGLGSHSP